MQGAEHQVGRDADAARRSVDIRPAVGEDIPDKVKSL